MLLNKNQYAHWDFVFSSYNKKVTIVCLLLKIKEI